jgi:hypothetical protein
MFDSVRDWRLDKGALCRVVIGAFLLAVMIFGPSAYGTLTSGSRVADPLKNVQGVAHVQVMLSFTPSSYHQQTLGEYGVFGGIRDNSVILLNVKSSDLRSLSHLYWIDEIVPFGQK